MRLISKVDAERLWVKYYTACAHVLFVAEFVVCKYGKTSREGAASMRLESIVVSTLACMFDYASDCGVNIPQGTAHPTLDLSRWTRRDSRVGDGWTEYPTFRGQMPLPIPSLPGGRLRKATPCTIEEHRVLGISLERARVTFMGLYADLAHSIGKTRRPCMMINKCSKAVGRLKDVMDDAVCRENQRAPDQDVTRCYYGLHVNELKGFEA